MLLTIFTPAYNRAALLERLYRSLCKQKIKDFEWLIVDDDSTDNTHEVVETLIKNENDFKIRYYKQEHGGKHRAINKAVKLAEGEFFFIVDSDDYLTDDALELLNVWTKGIRDNDKIAGVSGLRVSAEGKVWGGNPLINSNEYIDATNFERDKYKLGGDKAEVYKTSVMRKYPFPEFEGEYFITEDAVWSLIAYDGYKIRWYNKPIYFCEYLENGLTRSGANNISGHVNNYNGFIYYIKQCRNIKSTSQFILNFSDYEKTAKHLKKTLTQRAEELEISFFRYLGYKLFQRPVILGIKKLRNFCLKNNKK